MDYEQSQGKKKIKINMVPKLQIKRSVRYGVQKIMDKRLLEKFNVHNTLVHHISNCSCSDSYDKSDINQVTKFTGLFSYLKYWNYWSFNFSPPKYHKEKYYCTRTGNGEALKGRAILQQYYKRWRLGKSNPSRQFDYSGKVHITVAQISQAKLSGILQQYWINKELLRAIEDNIKRWRLGKSNPSRQFDYSGKVHNTVAQISQAKLLGFPQQYGINTEVHWVGNRIQGILTLIEMSNSIAVNTQRTGTLQKQQRTQSNLDTLTPRGFMSNSSSDSSEDQDSNMNIEGDHQQEDMDGWSED